MEEYEERSLLTEIGPASTDIGFERSERCLGSCCSAFGKRSTNSDVHCENQKVQDMSHEQKIKVKCWT